MKLNNFYYDIYYFSKKEWLCFFLQNTIFLSVLSILFFESLYGLLLLSPYLFILYRKQKKIQIAKRKWKINEEFKDAILNLSAALEAGYSIENALVESIKDLSFIYNENSLIIKEFTYMVRQLKTGSVLEELFLDFAERSNVEDISSFAQIFTTCKRSGGDLIQIIRTTARSISEKIEVKREIYTLITAKKYEASIMKLIPFFILGYLQLFCNDLIRPLYHSFFGVSFMLILLILYFSFAHFMDRIVEIEI